MNDLASAPPVVGGLVRRQPDASVIVEATCLQCEATKRAQAWKSSADSMNFQLVGPAPAARPCPHWRALDELIGTVAKETLGQPDRVQSAVAVEALEDWLEARGDDLGEGATRLSDAAADDLQARIRRAWMHWSTN
jgi:hypothetical protein